MQRTRWPSWWSSHSLFSFLDASECRSVLINPCYSGNLSWQPCGPQCPGDARTPSGDSFATLEKCHCTVRVFPEAFHWSIAVPVKFPESIGKESLETHQLVACLETLISLAYRISGLECPRDSRSCEIWQWSDSQGLSSLLYNKEHRNPVKPIQFRAQRSFKNPFRSTAVNISAGCIF